MKSIFMGNFHEVLSALVKKTNVMMVVVEENKSTVEIENICRRNAIPITFVKDSSDIDTICFKNCICFIASFGILLTNKNIEQFSQVINIHPGDVFTCRGRHPLPLAIIKKLPLMTLTAHTINSEKIDAGNIIAMISLPIDYKSSYKKNEKRLRLSLYNFTICILSIINSNDYFEWDWFSNKKALYNKRIPTIILDTIVNCESLENL